MAKKKREPQDDRLVAELYEKLNWFTFQATEEEFDEKQVKAILELLDRLDPFPEGEPDTDPEAEAAFLRFREKYNITEEALAKKNRGRTAGHRRFFSGPGRAAAAVLAGAFVAVALTGIGASAVLQRPFFEIVREGANSMRITVTGSATSLSGEPAATLENGEKAYYASWDEVKAEEPELLVPGELPEGYELKELSKTEAPVYDEYKGVYENAENKKLTVWIQYYESEYSQWFLNNLDELSLVKEEGDTLYYQNAEGYQVIGNAGRCLYMMKGNKMEELECVARGLQ
ncbi:MAG: hypothetical protein Q4C65_03565 [Eubacteriales bacterium]|nr:hypothetical protein [Eubacteriales bacterium]